MPTPDAHLLISTPRQWESLISPVRVEIIELLSLRGPSSIAQIAAHMGRPADTLYHHVRVLQAAGVVLQRDFRKIGRRIEAVYKLAASRLKPDYDIHSGRNLPPLKRLATAVLRMADRAFDEALDRGDSRFMPPKQNAWARRQVGRLTPNELDRVLRHFQAVSALLARGNKRRSGMLYSWTNFFMPVPNPQRRRNVAKPK